MNKQIITWNTVITIVWVYFYSLSKYYRKNKMDYLIIIIGTTMLIDAEITRKKVSS